ncbi:aldo/keto reductase [bacterium]|nr:aldo/keto reductase [bacterium]
MNKRQLGNSELYFSEIGFGAWAVGGSGYAFGWGEQDDNESIAAIRHALDLGINWIDTAAIYGLGHSEEVVAKAIKGIRNNVLIATKCSLVWDENRDISSSLNADSVRSECEASLKRLNTDVIDLYQIHWPSDDERIEEGWAEIGRLIEEGKVRYAGVSNFQVEHLERAQKIRPITSLQPPYSMMRRGVEGDIFKFCRENNIGVIPYSPMQSGLLTGKFSRDRLQPDDWRNESAEFMEPNLTVNLEFVDELRIIADKYDKTVAQLAVAWVLRREEVSSAIVGARRPSQIEETAGSSGCKIEEVDFHRIDELLQQRAEKVGKAGGTVRT